MSLSRQALLLCVIFFTATYVPLTHAAQTAIVTASKAVVFADKQLLAPIGFIRQGKKIMVGEVARQYGTILPITVAGRVAYIQTKDISTIDSKNQAEEQKSSVRATHKFYNTITSEVDDNLRENNHFGLELGTSSMSGDWKTLSDLTGQSNPTMVTGRIFFEHRPLIKRLSWGVGMLASSASGTELKYSTFGFDFQLYFSLFKSQLINVEAGLAPTLLALTNLSFKGPPSQEESGSAWGYSLIGRLLLFPHATISFHGTAFYQNLTYENYENVFISSLGRSISIGSSTNVGVTAAMAIGFE